jgi:hypothetical protein
MLADRCTDYTSPLTAAYNRILLGKLIVVQLVQKIFLLEWNPDGVCTVFSATYQGLSTQLQKLEDHFMSAYLNYLFNTIAATICP